MREKFAAKFAEAGNLKLQDVSQFLTSSLPAAGLTSIVFHSIFPQAVSSRAASGDFSRLQPREFTSFKGLDGIS